MIAVIFEVWPAHGRTDEYFDLAAALRTDLERIDGFISVERFESVTSKGKYLSLSFWRDEDAIRTCAVWQGIEAPRREGAKAYLPTTGCEWRAWYATMECRNAPRRPRTAGMCTVSPCFGPAASRRFRGARTSRTRMLDSTT